jgi:hypothetical protein
VSGWGYTEVRQYNAGTDPAAQAWSTHLKLTSLTIFSKEVCIERWSKMTTATAYQDLAKHESMICAGSDSGTSDDACQGSIHKIETSQH